MSNREKLINLMTEYKLAAPAVARILNVTPGTVRVWRTVNAKEIPDTKLELLKIKLDGIK